MAIREDLQVKIEVDGKETTKSIKDVTVSLKDLNKNSNDTAGTFANLKKSFSSLGAGAIVLNQSLELVGKAYRALAGPIGVAIQLAEEQEGAESRLANTLALVGDLTGNTLNEFKSFASQLQENSTVGDEYVLSLLSTAKAMGLTNDQAKNLTQASVDLSAATGKDVKSSFEKLLKSFGGFAGELSEAIPAVKTLTSEQLKAGGAVDIVAEKFKGFGKAATKSLSGTKAQLRNTFGDLRETIGKLFIDIFNVPGGVEASKKFFEDAIRTINTTVRPLLLELKDQFISVFEGINKAIRGVNFEAIARSLEVIAPIIAASLGVFAAINLAPFVLAVGTIAAKFIIISVAVASLLIAIDILIRNMDKIGQVGALFADVFLLALSKVREGIASLFFFIFQSISEAIQAIATMFPQFAGAGATAVSALTTATGVLAEEIIGAQSANERLFNSLEENAKGLDLGFGKTLFDEGNKFIKNFTEGMKASEKSAKNIAAALPDNQAKPEPQRATSLSPDLFKGFSEGANEISAGMDMFKGTVAGGFSGGLSAFAGGIGMMMSAANMMADFVQKLIDFIPEFLDKIANIFESLENLPEKLIKSFKNLGTKFLSFVRNFIANIIKFFGDGLDTLIPDLFNAIGDMFGNIGDALENFMVNKLPAMLEKMIGGAFIKAFARMFGMMGRMMSVIWKSLIKAFPLMAKAFVNGMMNAMKTLANEISRIFGGKKIFNIPDDFGDKLANLGKKVGKANDQLFRVLDLEAEAKAAKLATILNPERIGRSIWDAIKRAFVLARDFFNELGMMVWDGLVAAFTKVIDWFKEKGAEIWKGLVAAFNEVSEWFKEKGAALWDGLTEAAGEATEWLKEKGGFIWDGFVAGVTEAGDWFGEMGTKLWGGFVSGMETFRDTIGGVLTKVGDTFSNALTSLPGKLQGAFDALKPANLMEKVFKIDYKGMGSLEKNVLKMDVPWSNFARGGVIGGVKKLVGDSKINDIVPILASPGEAIIPKSLMGNPAINSVIEGILSGKLTSLEDMSQLILGPLNEGLKSLMSNPVQFNQGGIVGGPKMAMASSMGGGSTSISNNFTFNISLDIDASATSLDATFIRNRLIPDIKKELKDSSLRGEFLLSNRGLR